MDNKQDNPIRKLRKALGWNQTKLATALNMGIATVQNWERGSHPSVNAIEKLQTIAAGSGLVDIAHEIGGLKTFGAVKVFEPRGSPGKVRVPNPKGNDLCDHMHNLLDQVMDSGDGDDIAAIEAVLTALTKERKR